MTRDCRHGRLARKCTECGGERAERVCEALLSAIQDSEDCPLCESLCVETDNGPWIQHDDGCPLLMWTEDRDD